MKTTYVGSSNTRHFTTEDAVGIDLDFERHVPLEVPAATAEFLLLDPQFDGEFVEGEYIPPVAPDELDDSIDHAQEPLPDL